MLKSKIKNKFLIDSVSFVSSDKITKKSRHGALDGISRIERNKTNKILTPRVSIVNVIIEKEKTWKDFFLAQKVSIAVSVLALFVAFAFGVWFTLNTSVSMADQEHPEKVLSDSTSVPAGSMVIEGVAIPGSNPQNSDAIFNTPIQYLQNYFAAINEPDIINNRKILLEKFLQDMKSPFVPAAETIAQQPHWKLILAIAFAESTMGKNCADNNCSNIGVAPGHRLWRKYESYSAWVIDFNRLLEKRYKDWTLQEMCGVYVQPCNKNWLLATQQILDALEESGIE